MTMRDEKKNFLRGFLAWGLLALSPLAQAAPPARWDGVVPQNVSSSLVFVAPCYKQPPHTIQGIWPVPGGGVIKWKQGVDTDALQIEFPRLDVELLREVPHSERYRLKSLKKLSLKLPQDPNWLWNLFFILEHPLKFLMALSRIASSLKEVQIVGEPQYLKLVQETIIGQKTLFSKANVTFFENCAQSTSSNGRLRAG